MPRDNSRFKSAANSVLGESGVRQREREKERERERAGK
jgi:hypothetical protein